MNLYRPTQNEISRAAQSAAHRHPSLAARIQRAAVILEANDVQLDDAAWDVRQVVRWHISSQSHKGAYIIVNGHCPCDDCRRNRVDYCKHAIACRLYAKILTNRLNADIRAGVVEIDGNGAYAKRLGIVNVVKAGIVYRFSDEASMVRYSAWLAAQDADPRVEELENLAEEENIKLPMAADLIAFFESHGYVIDLETGEAMKVSVELNPAHMALSHLYGLAA